MIEAFKLVGRIALDGGQAVEKGLSGVESKLDKASKKFTDAGKKTTDFGKSLLPLSGIATGAGLAIFALMKKTGDYADAILDASDQTGMSTDAIQEYEHIAKVAGISQDSFTKASKTLTKQMTNLAKGTSNGAKALQELGIDFVDLEKASPDERLEILTTALAGVEDPAKRAQLGTDLLKGSYDDLAPAIAMGAEKMDDLRQEAHELGSVMDKDALVKANEFRVSMERLTTRFQNTGREIAMKFMPVFEDVLLPAIEKGIGLLSKLADWIGNLSPETILWVSGIGALVAILAPAIMFIGLMLTAIGKAISIIKVITGVVKLFNLAMLMNPIGIVILSIIALIAIIVVLRKNWDQITAFLKKIWGDLSKKAKEVFFKIRDDIVNAFKRATDGAIKQVTDLKDKAVRTFTNIRTDVDGRIKSIRDGIVNGFTDAKNRATNVFNTMRDAIVKPIHTARDRIQDTVNRIKGFFTNLKLTMPSIKMPKLPRFKVDGKLDLLNLPPKIPKLSVSWHAKGGYFDGATLFGAGEAGREALIPLENRRYMQPFAQAISENLGATGTADGQAQKIEIPVILNGREIARVMSKDIDRELEKRRATSKRGGRQ